MNTNNARPLGVGPRPGGPPADSQPDDREQLLQRIKAEQLRRETALAIIRADLSEQPTADCIRSAARRWAQQIHEIASDLAAGGGLPVEQPLELGGDVLAAFMLHVEEQVRREVYAEIEEADRRSWEPVRRHLERTRHALEWSERRDIMRAAKKLQDEEIIARRQQVAQAKESA